MIEDDLIKGSGFTMKEGSDDSHTDGPKVEFRTGETSDTASERERREKLSRKHLDHEPATDVEYVEQWIQTILKDESSYSETLVIRPNGKFDGMRTDNTLSYLAGIFDTPEGLYAISRELRERNPEYEFSFENDPQGQWMKYTVSKK